MFEIIEKEILNPTVTRIKVSAPAVARKAQPGQFIILRTDRDGERIPLTIADYDPEEGTVTVIFQVVGATTELLNTFEAGDSLADFVGPLGKPTDLGGIQSAAVVGGGVGCAIALPIARALKKQGARVDCIIGFRNRDLVILEKEFLSSSDRLFLMTDDGTAGEKGLVTDALKKQIEAGVKYDRVITIGPLIMMKFVCRLTKEYSIPTVASMNPIMIDGTGMCGGCRLTVGGKVCFACVDGPDFDGHLIDFDEAINRSGMYRPFEKNAREKMCNLLKEAQNHD